MSCRTYTNELFGVCTTGIVWKEGKEYEEGVLELIKGSYLEKLLKEYQEEEKGSIWDWVVDESEGDNNYGVPNEWLLTQVMVEKEQFDIGCFEVDDYCDAYVGLCPHFPFSDYMPPENHSIEFYKERFKHYFSFLTDSEIKLDYYTASYTG